jgi:hypothetical protein
MRLQHTNSTISIKRRTITSGNKKADAVVQSGIAAFISDTGTTADHEQTYLIMLNVEDVTSINPDTDTINDGTSDYKIANSSKKTYTYSIRCVKSI